MNLRKLYWIEKQKYQKHKRKYDEYENRSKHQAFYQTKQWQRLRLEVLSRALCEANYSGCTVFGVEVHHLVPLSVDWSLRLSLENLSLRCKECHSKDTRKEQTERKQAERSAKIEDTMNDLNDFE